MVTIRREKKERNGKKREGTDRRPQNWGEPERWEEQVSTQPPRRKIKPIEIGL